MKKILEYKTYIAIILVTLLVIASNLYNVKEEESIFAGQYNNSTQELVYLYVDIKGEVKNPGVYKVEEGTRIYQVVLLAGGYNENASTANINLSKIVKDEQVIEIPNIEDVVVNTPSTPTDNIEDTTIDINQAPISLLETLPGIGPSTAAAIVKYREENSYFNSIEDILNVPGIGETTFENIKDLIHTD